jgi:hypothetical protein
MLAMERYAREKQLPEVTLDVTIQVARRLGYAGDDGPGQELVWSEEALERLSRVPKFERQMVREMVDSLARDAGHQEVNYEIADEMLRRVRELWEAEGEGAFGYFKGMSAPQSADQDPGSGEAPASPD